MYETCSQIAQKKYVCVHVCVCVCVCMYLQPGYFLLSIALWPDLQPGYFLLSIALWPDYFWLGNKTPPSSVKIPEISKGYREKVLAMFVSW